MIDIDALKRDKRPQSAWVVHALIDRLEAAEKERDFAKTEIARLHDDIRELTDVRVLDEEDRGRIVAWRQGTSAKPAPSVPDDMIEQAVTRFLSWKLPKDFHPDGGMVFIPTKGRGYDSPHWPCGTNLLNAQQARDMLRYVLAAQEAKP